VWLIERAAVGFRGPLGRLLESRPLIGLGTISYGLYVIHNFAPVILWSLARRLDLPRAPLSMLPVRIVLLSLITIALAWVSWQVMEQPIQRWKRLFPYRGKNVDVGRAPDIAQNRRKAA
jgi:peptidoglycan/LPS O-acetylase OafA/YrhL